MHRQTDMALKKVSTGRTMKRDIIFAFFIYQYLIIIKHDKVQLVNSNVS
jgi:hypothetical protein